MADIEKYVARRINKDVAPDAIHPNGDRKFLPGDLIDAVNCRIGIDGRVRNVWGNEEKQYLELPDSGENRVIGSLPYRKRNTLIYFIYNSDNHHRIVEFDPVTGEFFTLLQGNIGFTEDSLIAQGGTIDDLLIWTDGIGPARKINIIRAKAGEYLEPFPGSYLVAMPPRIPPTAVLVTDPSVIINRISEFNWQFTYQFGYEDNELSVFRPISKVVHGAYKPFVSSDDNAIDVTIYIPSELVGIVKFVNVAVRKGNNGSFAIFKTIKNPATEEQTVRYTGYEALQEIAATDQTKSKDAISPVIKALELIENRLITTLNSVGFDINDNDFGLTLAVATEAHDDTKKYFKEGGVYIGGILFEDDNGNQSFVKKVQTVPIPYSDVFETFTGVEPITLNAYNSGLSLATKKKLQWTLTGTPPPGMKRFQIVLTKNTLQGQYVQFTAPFVGYIKEMQEGDTEDDFPDNVFQVNGHVLSYPDHAIAPYSPRVIGIKLPNNLPFQPTKGNFIRFFHPTWPYDRVMVIKEVLDGQYAFFEGPLSEPEAKTTLNDLEISHSFVEIFTLAEQGENRFYELGQVYDIVDDEFSVTTGYIYGDTFTTLVRSNVLVPTGDEHRYDFRDDPLAELAEFNADNGLGIYNSSWVLQGVVTQHTIETPTLLSKSVVGSVAEWTSVFYDYRIFDYTKIDHDYGRAHVEYFDEKNEDLNTVVGISDPYVQNSKINGLSSFAADNTYDLPVDRTPVRALVKTGGVLLAIHERMSSSLYIGEGFIRQGQDFILAKTESIVGDDRELAETYGTINPESVIVANNNAYFWDLYRGAVVRYTNAGLFPVSNYGMRTYFLEKSRLILPYKDRSKVVTAFDIENDELIITFHDIIDDDNNIVVPGETWVFNVYLNEWKGRRRFMPEAYGKAPNYLIAFQEGRLWMFTEAATRNNFFGIQYDRMWRFASNPYLGKNKKYLNVHIDGEIDDGTNQDFIPMRIYTKEGKESFTPRHEFDLDEGKYNGPVLRDINTPGVDETQLPLLSGDEIVSNYAEIEIINNRTDDAPCGQVNVVYLNQEYSR
jgi:hypothetical protein